MANFNDYFQFSAAQLRVISVLSAVALILTGYLLVRSWATPPLEAEPLPVFLGDADVQLTGIFQLDPNTAPADSLELIPGIGKVLADRIVEYRSTARFDEPIDITRVKGIGPNLYERARPYLRISR